MRLDRALISSDFQDLFPEASLTNLEVTTSDHCPLLLELDKCDNVHHLKPFRFENAWLKEPICQQIVQDVWNQHIQLSLYEKLTECANVLSIWGQEVTGNFKKRINGYKKILKQLKGRHDPISIKVVQTEKKRLSDIYVQHEIFWRQRSKHLWLQEGDKNSKYFHAATKNRCKANQILKLQNNDGDIVEWGSINPCASRRKG